MPLALVKSAAPEVTNYRVLSPRGYIGRASHTAPLAPTTPAFAYCYSTREQAEQVARGFPGSVIEAWGTVNTPNGYRQILIGKVA